MKPRVTKIAGPRRPTAGWPLDKLIWGLRKARWGDLSGRAWHGVRAVLLALAEIARQGKATRTGRIEATEWQIAGHTGYEVRWVRVCLQRLEYAGILTWWRGGVENGRPKPSIFQLSRRPLAAMLATARQTADEAEREHNAATMHRLQQLRSGFVKARQPRYRRSEHAELRPNLRPTGEASTRQAPPGEVEQPTLEAVMTAAALHEARTTAPAAPGPDDTGPPPDDPPAIREAKAMIRAQLRTSARRFAHA